MEIYKLVFFLILIGGAFAAHFLFRKVVRGFTNSVYAYLTNAALFVVFFVLYFVAGAVIESWIYGSSGLYDVELVMFIAFGLLSSLFSSKACRRSTGATGTAA